MYSANKSTEELYSEEIAASPRPKTVGSFAQKCKTSYKRMTNKISDGVCAFVQKYKGKLKTIENILEPSFLIYGYSVFLDYLSSYSVCETASDELNPFYAKLFENYGIGNGHLMAAMWDVAVLGAIYELGKYVDKAAHKIDPRIDTLPFFRKFIPYAYITGRGISHYLASLNNW